MKTTTNKPTMQELLTDAASLKPDVVPDGWKTAVQWGKEMNWPGSTTREMINKLLTDGKVESKKYRVQCAAGVRLIPHYRPA